MKQFRFGSIVLAGALVAGLGSSAGAHTAGESSFTFIGEGCSQFVTNLQVDAASVRSYVPAAYSLSREAVGKAAVGYRIHSCPRMSVDGVERLNVVWAELGVRITSPEGRLPDHLDTHAVDGHDYYMIFLHTNDSMLAEGMAGLGAPASYEPSARYETAMDTLSGALTAGAHPGEGSYDVAMEAITTETPEGAFPDFHVISWFEGQAGLIRYDDLRSHVTGRLGPITVLADPGTTLARITGQTQINTTDAFVKFSTDTVVELLD